MRDVTFGFVSNGSYSVGPESAKEKQIAIRKKEEKPSKGKTSKFMIERKGEPGWEATNNTSRSTQH